MRKARLFLAGAILALLMALPVKYSASEHLSMSALTATLPQAVLAQDADKAAPSVDIQVNTGEKRVIWYANPVVLAVGVIGLVLLLAVIAAGRGNSTTIIKE
jgi:hypothetical protein